MEEEGSVYGLSQIFEQHREAHEKGLRESAKIAEEARKIGLIFGDYKDILRLFLESSSIDKKEIREMSSREDLSTTLAILVRERVLVQSGTSYSPSDFTRQYLNSWGRSFNWGN